MASQLYGKDNPVSRAVYQIDRDTGEIIDEFECAREAEHITGVRNTHIADVCKGKHKTAGGYKWAYVNENSKIFRSKPSKKENPYNKIEDIIKEKVFALENENAQLRNELALANAKLEVYERLATISDPKTSLGFEPPKV